MLKKDVVINKVTRYLVKDEVIEIGVEGENLQEKLVFKFDDEFVDGQGRLELIMQNGTKTYFTLDKVNDTYEVPIKSIITKPNLRYIQLVVTQGTGDEIPIFKSKKLPVQVSESINAVGEAPEGYDEWIDVADTKLNQIDNLDISAVKVNRKATVTITDKEGQDTSVDIYDGETGATGANGRDGTDGITPTIGENGNWYLGETDTGKPSRGIQGETGATGQDGRDGYVQYTAGNNITIENNVISASGGKAFYLGNASDYTVNNKLDISELEPGLYCFNILAQNDNIYVTGKINGITFNGILSVGTDNYSYTSNYVAYLKINTKISTCTPTTSGTNVGVIYFSSTYSGQETVTYWNKTIIITINSQGTAISISNSNGTIFNLRTVTKDDNQTITGRKTFSTLPETSVVPTQTYHMVNKKYVDDTVGKYSTMPTASSTYEGQIVQYVGTTDSTYTNGYFYKCVNDSNTYSWEQINVQPGSSGSNGSYVGMLTELTDTNNANCVNFKKARPGVYYNDKNRALLYINSTYDNAIGNNQISNVEYVVITEDISNVYFPSSDLDFGYIVFYNQFGKLQIKKLSVKTDGFLKETFVYTYPDIQVLNENAQDFIGEKTFYTIPKVSSYTVPTTDTQLVAKKYVDDAVSSAGGGGNIEYLGKYSDFNTTQTAINLNNLEVGKLYVVSEIANSGVNRRIYVKATTKVNGTSQTFTANLIDYDLKSLTGDLYITLSTAIPESVSSSIIVGEYDCDTIWATGSVSRTIQNIYLSTSGITFSGSSNTLFYGVTEGQQTFYGYKTFVQIPQVSSYTAPTYNTQLTAKKYVDDKITTFSGYNASKTQVLKNVNGTITWVDE